MNFFDAQDSARRVTRWLVVVYVVATLMIIAGVTTVAAAVIYGFGPDARTPDAPVLPAVAGLTLLVIVGATVYRTARLATGGGRVARELGGVRLGANETDFLRKRLRNVVEEMAIASGVTVPEIYVLEHEDGINAFAAGFTPGDAAIAVTRGALEVLDRDELQGVIAHEFSHILNGDMRLNIRMMGVLFGIMVVGLIGRMILRGGSRTGMHVRARGKNAGGVLAVGVALAILGWIGVFFARVIKAAVSRQREMLADASAVQFTRQTDGIANALKKIGGYAGHSYLEAADAEEVSHMLFARGARFSSLFATHPPLTRRIRALDPQFDESQYPQVERRGTPDDASADSRAAGLAGGADSIPIDPAEVVGAVGQPGPEHIAYANALHASIPEELLSPARESAQAYLLVLALLLDRDAAMRKRQLELLRGQLGGGRAALVQRYADEIASLGPAYDLALLEIAFPALRDMGEQQQSYLLDLGTRLTELDGIVDLREFCLFRVLRRGLREASSPTRRGTAGRTSRRATRRAAATVVTIISDRGHQDEQAKHDAFRAGMAHFGNWADGEEFAAVGSDVVPRFRDALDVLEGLNASATQTLLRAATAAAVRDGRVTVAETELLRAVCASLGCPLPPVVAGFLAAA